MIRKLTEKDHLICDELVKQKPAENLFIIGDIEAYGYEEDFQTIWGDFDDDGQLRAVLLKYQKNYIPFALGEFDAEGFAAIINKEEAPHLSGLKEITAQVEPYIKHSLKTKREMYYAKCTSVDQLTDDIHDDIHLANLEDLDALVELLSAIPEFESSEFTVESKRRNMEKGISRTYYVKEDERMVSSASTTAENSSSAMVVGVCTLDAYKKKGYASHCMTQLCMDLLDEGKELCLFYDNPEAGKIYKRLGFEDIGFWMMYTFE